MARPRTRGAIGIKNAGQQHKEKYLLMQDSKIKKSDPEKKFRRVLAASTLAGDSVRNSAHEDLGKVDEIMVDIPSGRVAYAVLSFGGILGMGNKLFAVPWSSLKVDEDEKCFILDVNKKMLEGAPGFDKSHWPDMGSEVYRYYGAAPRQGKSPSTQAGEYVREEIEHVREGKHGRARPSRRSPSDYPKRVGWA
jgi:sporulation protein YlmC with PRC-barrel domain